MPRRAKRDTVEPIDTAEVAADLARIKRERDALPVERPWLPQDEWNALRDKRARERWERQERAAMERVKAALDWQVCAIAGCGNRPTTASVYQRNQPAPILNPDEDLPLCYKHEAVVWRQVQRREGDETTILNIEQLRERERKRWAEEDSNEKTHWLRIEHGEIYYLRLNGLIKVGWSRALRQRLKAYGPDVQVLCHYPATRQDETTLHRQLTPYRAKGREWYTESQLIFDLVDQAIAKYGEPYASAEWTEPKAVIKPRKRTR